MLVNASKLTSNVEEYLSELRRLRASGDTTGEISTYLTLTNLLSASDAMLRPKVFCAVEVAEQGAGHPGFALTPPDRCRRGSHAPERSP